MLAFLSPDAAAFLGHKLTSVLPEEMKGNAAMSWFDGHQSLGLMYLSMVLFFVTRTVSRLVDGSQDSATSRARAGGALDRNGR